MRPALRNFQTATFANVRKSLPDAMQDLKKATDADTSENKIDLGAGVYRNEQGQYHEFDVVRQAKFRLDALQLGHDYSATTGVSSFTSRAAKLLFGEESPAVREKRIASVQTVGGTGANRVGAAFLRRNLYSYREAATVYLGEPAWGNYRPLFENAGFRVKTYTHCYRGATGAAFDEVVKAMAEAPERSTFVLQAFCHNPTGLDYSREQWQEIGERMLRRQHFAFFDAAYIGFGNGKANAREDDSWVLRHFMASGVDTLVCQSFSKTFGLYSERVGALHVICQSAPIAENVFDQLRAQTRWEVSSAPAYGARLVDIILADHQLTQHWLQELHSAAARIDLNRRKLYHFLNSMRASVGWAHMASEKGLFSYLQLSESQIEALMKEHHVYLPPNGRINVAGLTQANIGRAAEAIGSVTRR